MEQTSGLQWTAFQHVVAQLQVECADVYLSALRQLKAGISEAETARLVAHLFAERGVVDHWYDVPVMVLFGTDRFVEGTTTTDYARKAPQSAVKLQNGDAMHLDFSPVDSQTGVWGDWSATGIFNSGPESATGDGVKMLEDVRRIQLQGIESITSSTTGAEIVRWYQTAFDAEGIELLDVRNNVGHSIHSGPKVEAPRVWLDAANTNALGEGVFTVEPGGARRFADGRSVVGRFEVCIYIPPNGPAEILGGEPNLPLCVRR